MKKGILFLAILALLVSLLPTAVVADDWEKFDNQIYYRITGTTLELKPIGSTAVVRYRNAGYEIIPPWTDNSKITKVIIYDGITELQRMSFRNMASLTEVVIAATVTSIAHDTFNECPSISRIIFEEGSAITYDGLGYDTDFLLGFDYYITGAVTYRDSSLITLCDYNDTGVQAYAEKYGFQYERLCKHHYVMRVQEKSATCTETGHSYGTQCTSCGKMVNGIDYPALGHEYSDEWSLCVTEQEKALGYQYRKCTRCGDDSTLEYRWYSWDIANGKLTINGSGEVGPFVIMNGAAPWYSESMSVTSAEINGVTALGYYALSELHNLKTITISSSVKRIGMAAMFFSSSLESVTFEEGSNPVFEACCFPSGREFTIYGYGKASSVYTYAAQTAGITYIDLAEDAAGGDAAAALPDELPVSTVDTSEGEAYDTAEPAGADGAESENIAQEETEAPVQEETEAPAQGEMEAPAQGEMEAPAQEENEAPAREETEVPAQVETEVPAQGETEAPAQEESPAEDTAETAPQDNTGSTLGDGNPVIIAGCAAVLAAGAAVLVIKKKKQK